MRMVVEYAQGFANHLYANRDRTQDKPRVLRILRNHGMIVQDEEGERAHHEVEDRLAREVVGQDDEIEALRSIDQAYERAFHKGVAKGKADAEDKIRAIEREKREAEASAQPNYNVPLTQGERYSVLEAFSQREKDVELRVTGQFDEVVKESTLPTREFACFEEYRKLENCKLETTDPLKCRDAVRAFKQCALATRKQHVINKIDPANSSELHAAIAAAADAKALA